jgi:hypothetical protein
VIPNLQEIARQLGCNPAYVVTGAAALLAAAALATQRIVNWFSDTNSRNKS